jgi:aminoglycoside phosphotransferase
MIPELPGPLAEMVSGYGFQKEAIGMSSAATYRLERSRHSAMYLKISPKNPVRELPQEKAVLAWLAGKLPVPTILYSGEDAESDYLLMSAVPGVNAAEIKGVDNITLVKLLAQGLKVVHSVPVNNCPFDRTLDKTVKMAEFNMNHNLVDEKDFDYVRHGKTTAELLSQLLALRPEREDPVFTHGDYCLPNIMIDKDHVSGFIDLSRAGIADRYQDIALAVRSIGSNLGPGLDRIFLVEYGIEKPDREKIEYYMLLDEFF